jgi:hypothetical protein
MERRLSVLALGFFCGLFCAIDCNGSAQSVSQLLIQSHQNRVDGWSRRKSTESDIASQSLCCGFFKFGERWSNSSQLETNESRPRCPWCGK